MSSSPLALGYSVPDGEPVLIPLGHMAVTGQTQSAGKTTTLEALATRSGRRVLAFVTKRGEAAFASHARRVPIYFAERADWQFVQAILEATMRERLKFERGWIIRASEGARTLADVQRNVQTLSTKAKGLSADIYLQLNAYLDIVVPQIADLPLTVGSGLACWEPLAIGPNVMDLSDYSMEMQSLIIAACLEHIYEVEEDTITIIPEAWEFVPRSRKSPVSYAAEALIRKGGTLRNFLWIDSQDLAGVHTPILKNIHVWLLGVQREINEIKRTLAHVHGVVAKPKPDMIASLGLGQFIACYGTHATTTYVRPNWITEAAARRVARGEAQAPIAPSRSRPYADFERHPPQGTFTAFTPAEDPMDAQLKADNARLAKDNQTLAARIAELEPIVDALREEITRMRRDQSVPAAENAAPVATLAPERRAGTSRLHGRPLDEDGAIEFTTERTLPPLPVAPLPPLPMTSALEFYEAFKARILVDVDVLGVIAKIAATRPEIIVEITPRVQTLKGDSLYGRLGRLIAEGYFDQPQLARDTNKELDRTGGMVHSGNLSKAFTKFVQEGFLVRSGDGYQRAPNLKVSTTELQAV
jgi:hypothetical protein